MKSIHALTQRSLAQIRLWIRVQRERLTRAVLSACRRSRSSLTSSSVLARVRTAAAFLAAASFRAASWLGFWFCNAYGRTRTHLRGKDRELYAMSVSSAA